MILDGGLLFDIRQCHGIETYHCDCLLVVLEQQNSLHWDCLFLGSNGKTNKTMAIWKCTIHTNAAIKKPHHWHHPYAEHRQRRVDVEPYAAVVEREQPAKVEALRQARDVPAQGLLRRALPVLRHTKSGGVKLCARRAF